MSKIRVCLWFDGDAEAAARYYVSLLPDSRIECIVRNSMDLPGGAVGEVMVVEFTLAGQCYSALNGGPHYQLTPAASLLVTCADQAELDRLWDALSTGGGQPIQCGWLTDKFGVTWQIVPEALMQMLKDKDSAKVRRVTEAFMPMVKLDFAAIEKAYAGA